MDLNKTIEKIEANREQTEASFVFCLWKDPQRYDDYKNVNEGANKNLICEEPLFYFLIGRGIRRQGFSNIDNITLDTYLSDKPTLRKHYEELNGWKACKVMMDLVDAENTDSYYNQIAKMNTLKILATKFDEMLSTPERFENSTNEEVYEAFELLNNSVALTTGTDSKIESLVVDEKYLQDCNAGMDQGISYAAGAPLLNYLTLGAPVEICICLPAIVAQASQVSSLKIWFFRLLKVAQVLQLFQTRCRAKHTKICCLFTFLQRI